MPSLLESFFRNGHTPEEAFKETVEEITNGICSLLHIEPKNSLIFAV